MFANDVHMYDSFEFYGYLVLSVQKTSSSYDEVAVGHKTRRYVDERFRFEGGNALSLKRNRHADVTALSNLIASLDWAIHVGARRKCSPTFGCVLRRLTTSPLYTSYLPG
jgi:hypothetical protein